MSVLVFYAHFLNQNTKQDVVLLLVSRGYNRHSSYVEVCRYYLFDKK